MKKAKIFYFTLQDEQTKEEKLDWFERSRLEQIPFDHITPDEKSNWINLTDNDFDSLLPLIDKDVKAGKSQEAIFQLFSRGLETGRDEWVYDFSKTNLTLKIEYLIQVYKTYVKDQKIDLDIKWDRQLDRYVADRIEIDFDLSKVRKGIYRPFARQYLYFDKHLNRMPGQSPKIFPESQSNNKLIGFMGQSAGKPFAVIATDLIPDLNCISPASGGTQCLPLYRYDKDGNRIDNITDWGLTQFQTYYNDRTINKQDIFHYTYAVLHHSAYRIKYELNLKREFPRLPFYGNFHQWVTWGKALMDLHLNYETIAPYGLKRVEIATKDNPKAKLKAEKTSNMITLDENTQLMDVPAIVWDYKLGSRSALEWILDQYKEKKPKDPTIAKLFNTYKFADYKEQVVDLLDRVCTVSVKTMEIIQQMPTA